MPTLGRKKRTKKQKKIRSLRPLKKLFPKRKLRYATGTRFRQFLKNYDELVASGEMKPIKEIEELRAKWAKYMNKDGTPSRSKLKSTKKREEWNADIKAFNKKYKRWGKKALKEIAEKQKEKRDKQAKTFGENQARRAVQEATEQGLTTDVDFERIAKEASENYLRMLELFALDSLNKLREELNIGSPVVQALAKMGLTTEVIDAYIDDFRNAYMNMPQEARDLAQQDDLNKAILELSNLHGSANLSDVLHAYIIADSEDEQQAIAEAGEFHADAVKRGYTNTSFSDFWDEARGTSSKKWGDFL